MVRERLQREAEAGVADEGGNDLGSEDTKDVESEATKSYDSLSDTEEEFDGRRPENLTARQRAMPAEFEGGLDALNPRTKRELTEEELVRKAEVNAERRVALAKLKVEQQKAAKDAIRAGKGARAKREEKAAEERRRRNLKRMGGPLPEGMVRISITKLGTKVIHNSSEPYWRPSIPGAVGDGGGDAGDEGDATGGGQ